MSCINVYVVENWEGKYLGGFDPVSGRPTAWVHPADVQQAMKWRSRDRAEEMSEGIGKAKRVTVATVQD